MELLREWLLALTGGALLVAVAESLCPEGAVKKVVHLIGGLLLLLIVLRPLSEISVYDLKGQMTDYELETQETCIQADIARNELMETIIAEQSAAYIVDKAAELGAVCEAEVRCEKGQDGLLLPKEVKVVGVLTPQQKEALTMTIEQELSIAREDQIFERGEER